MANFTAGTSFQDGVTNDVTALKLEALVANAVPTSNLALTSTNGTIANFTSSTANITLGTIPTLTAGTTTGTAGIFTSGTIATLNSTTGTIPTIVATTLITTGTGTAAAPAIVPTGDTNTGIFFPAADTIAFSEGGTEGMRIDSSGKVLIGTTSNDTGGRLEVKQASSETGIGIQSSGTDDSKLYFRTASGTYGGDISFNGSYVKFSSGTTEAMRIDSSGNVLIGGTAIEPAGGAVNGISLKPSSSATVSNGMVEICNANSPALILGSTTGDATLARFRRAGTVVGSISVTAGATAFVTSSDYRLKTNLEPIVNGIERVKQLPVYSFNWKIDESGNKVDGFIAHEAKAIVPESVVGEKDAVDAEGNPIYQGIDQSKIVPLLTAALKEAIAKIEVLESKVAALEAA
jgi:hypothetical protein